MSSFRSPSAQTAPGGSTNRSPRRKMSMDLMRIKNFPSTLSLRKTDQDASQQPETLPSSSTFSRLRNFARNSTGTEQADTSTDSRTTKRTSRLLDAFKPSRKPAPSFEVVRKPPNRSTTSFHSSINQPSPQVEVLRPVSRLSIHNPPDTLEPAPRISLSAPHPDSSPQLPLSNTDATLTAQSQNALNTRSQYPPSTTKTRRLSNNLAATSTRRTSDPYLNLGSASNSRAQSPSASPNVDGVNGSFSLHSFRNVRSASDVSNADDPSTQTHSRVHSVISVDEYVTPREEIPEPRYLDDTNVKLPLDTGSQTKVPDVNRAQSTSPSPIGNAKPASISAAKFRQASRQRSESGTIPTIDAVQGGSAFVRPPRSRTPSQDLAAMEAVLAQKHPRNYRPTDVECRKSADIVSLTAAASATNIKDESSHRKRGFFIVVEGLDRAGKSTQVERLAEHLQAKAIKFPERTTAIGQMINSYLAQTSDLDDQAIHLLFSANRWECVASIKKTLEAGESIVCDRYAFSGIAYSVAKGLSYDWCRNPDVGLPLPDLTMFLDLDAQTAAARGGYGEERYEKLEFQAKVREAFTRVSQDVKSHGGRWVTIDASKTLDQVTDDIQKAVQRVTTSIDRVGAKLGKLFVSERPANQRAPSSSELFPPAIVPNVKRSSMSSEETGRRGKSFDQPRIQVNTATTHGTFPTSRPSGSPLNYTEQLAAVRSAAAGTLSGLFSGSNATLDQQSPSAQPEADGPSPVNATRGQGFDSVRVLGKHTDGTGRRRTLIDVIGEIENQQPQQAAWPDHRRSLSAAAESTSPTTTQFAADGLPSTYAQSGRVRRSTDHGRVSQLPTIASSGAQPNVGPRQTSLTVQSGNGSGNPEHASVSSPTTPAIVADRPLPSPSSRAASFSSADPSAAARASILSPAARTASPAITTSSRSSMASPPPPISSTTSPIPRPASAAASTDYAYPTPAFSAAPPPNANANASDSNSFLSAQHLSMLNVQQGQAEMQEQYMRNYMAMMANPMLAQQAHYQMMLQRHQQQYYGRAASAIGASNLGAGANGNGVQPSGGPPLAAFMQPSSQPIPAQSNDAKVDGSRTSTNAQRDRMRSTHKRTHSSGSLLENATPASNGQSAAVGNNSQQPMLSMMMAPPPATHGSTSAAGSATTATLPQQYYQPSQHMYAQPMFYPNAGGQQAFPPMMGGAWPGAAAATMAGGLGGRPVYPSTRSEIATPTAGLRTQRSKDDGLRSSQQQ